MKKDERFKKYWKMKSIGVPVGAIRNAMWRDGLDGSVLDNDCAWETNYETLRLESVTNNASSLNRNMANSSLAAHPTVRRKKIFWRAIDPGHIKENSLWSMVGGGSMSILSFDSKEFNDLFIESVDNTNEQQLNKKKSLSAVTGGSKPKRAIHNIVNVKRSMNGGIALALIRMEYEKIATIVENM